MKTYAVALLLGLALAGANHAMLGSRPELAACRECLALLWGGPIALAVLVAAAASALASPRAAAVSPVAETPAAPPPPPREPVENAALRLLATLQEEGRLVDFFTEDIAAYSDEQIGAATRGIHASCQKALRSAVALEPIMAGEEGAAVTVPAGFDPAAIRLVGNVTGAPPFTGVLRHGGWRATTVNVPARAGQDPRVVAPAEVEIG
jgi:hypothetical protein